MQGCGALLDTTCTQVSRSNPSASRTSLPNMLTMLLWHGSHSLKPPTICQTPAHLHQHQHCRRRSHPVQTLGSGLCTSFSSGSSLRIVRRRWVSSVSHHDHASGTVMVHGSALFLSPLMCPHRGGTHPPPSARFPFSRHPRATSHGVSRHLTAARDLRRSVNIPSPPPVLKRIKF